MSGQVAKVRIHISNGTLELLSMYSDNISRTNNSIGFHNVRQSSFTNMHPSIWKPIPILMKEESLTTTTKK